MNKKLRVGQFSTLAELWQTHPEGGRDIEWAIVGDTLLNWDKYQHRWSGANEKEKGSSPLPYVTFVDRGLWSPNTYYYASAFNPQTSLWETSDVWYYGCRYRCTTTGTEMPPRWGSADWVMIEGNPNLILSFEETEFFYELPNMRVPLTLRASIYHQDITSLLRPEHVRWERKTIDSIGVARMASDEIWAQRFADRHDDPRAIVLTLEDLDQQVSPPLSLASFTAVVNLEGFTASLAADLTS